MASRAPPTAPPMISQVEYLDFLDVVISSTQHTQPR
jgi:hypothetical protein